MTRINSCIWVWDPSCNCRSFLKGCECSEMFVLMIHTPTMYGSLVVIVRLVDRILWRYCWKSL